MKIITEIHCLIFFNFCNNGKFTTNKEMNVHNFFRDTLYTFYLTGIGARH